MCFMREANVLHARSETDDFQRLADALLAFRRAHAAIAQRHVDVVEHVEIGNQVEALEDEADLLVANARALVVGQAAHVGAVELVRAGVERFEQTRDVQEGRLARAGRSGHRDELALGDFETEVAQRMRLDEIRAIDLADAVHGEHGGPSLVSRPVARFRRARTRQGLK
jgi:hypothetical protein